MRMQDHVFDGVAMLLLTGGTALFALGRSALASLANGTYPAPIGESWVARAEFHDNQTKLGMWLIAAGLTVSLVSAARYAFRRRRVTR